MAGSTLLDRVYLNTATVGTGTITLGAAKSNAFCIMSEAGAVNGGTFTFILEDGTDFEISQGVYASAGPTMTRATVLLSKIGGTAGTTKLTLSGAATMRIIAAKEDLTDTSLLQSGTMATARLGSGTANSTTFLRGDQTYAVPLLNGLVSYQLLTSTQTVTIPAGATRAEIRLVGGGGGGGGAKATACVTNAAGGPGAAGAALRKFLTGLTPGNTIALTIGAAGTAGAVTPGNGGNGGNSSLASGTQTITTLTAPGGGGGQASQTSVNGAPGTDASIATNGDINLAAHSLLVHNPIIVGGSETVLGGQDSPDAWGYGAPGRTLGNTGGSAGNGFGAGGSGGTSTSTSVGQLGGAGTAGACEIYWYT